MKEPLLNSPNSIDTYCDQCKSIMNNNYYYSVGSGGYVNKVLCPLCVPKNTTRFYKKYVFKHRKPSFHSETSFCPFCNIL